MKGKVKCTCGWSWNKSDSSAKDMYICHECGRDNSNNMKNGGWLDSYDKAQDGSTIKDKPKLGAGKYYTTTGDIVDWGTPEYERAYNRGEVLSEDGVRSEVTLEGGVLPEVVLQNNYKRGFWEKYRDKIIEENKDTGVLGAIIGTPISAITSLPQLAATYGITGEMQRPSEAMDIENPYGAFAVDAVTDPTTLIGVGELSGLSKLTKENALAKLANIRNIKTSVAPELTEGVATQGFPNPLGIVDKVVPRPPTPGMLFGMEDSWNNYSPLNLLPFYGKKLSSSGTRDFVGFRKFGNSIDDVIESQSLRPKGTGMGSKQIMGEGNWAEPGRVNENYSGVFEATMNPNIEGSNIKLEKWRNRNGIVGTTQEGDVAIPLTDPGLSFNRRLPFSNKYIPIDKERLINNKFQLATQLPYAQSLAEKYGLWAGLAGGAGYISGGKKGAQENIDLLNKYTVDPIIEQVKPYYDEVKKEVIRQSNIKKQGGILKNGGWLDNYGEEANANEGHSSASKEWVGDGYSNVGRNYSPAWGGQFQMGGNVYPVNYVPQAQDGANLNTPESWEKSIRNIEHQIGNPNQWSIDSYRQLQKQINEYKFWRENTPEGKAVYDSHNETNEYVVPLPNHLKIYKPLNMLEEVTPNYKMGGSIPGSVGFTYARTKGIPSNGPYAKKTMASAQGGDVIKDDRGQLAHPHQPTEISGDTMITDGYGYIPLYVVPDKGEPRMVYPNTGKHTFPGATKFTEYPVAQGGETLEDEKTYVIPESNLEEVVVEPSEFSKYRMAQKKIIPWEQFANERYLGNFERNMGQTLENLPEYRKQEYDDYINKLAFNEYVKTHPQAKGEKRGAYIDRIQKLNEDNQVFERAYEANAEYNPSTDVNIWRKGLMGLGSIVLGPDTVNKLKQNSDYFSTKEKQHIGEHPIASAFDTTLGTLAPLEIPGNMLYGKNNSALEALSGRGTDVPMEARILGDPLIVIGEGAPLIGKGFSYLGSKGSQALAKVNEATAPTLSKAKTLFDDMGAVMAREIKTIDPKLNAISDAESAIYQSAEYSKFADENQKLRQQKWALEGKVNRLKNKGQTAELNSLNDRINKLNKRIDVAEQFTVNGEGLVQSGKDTSLGLRTGSTDIMDLATGEKFPISTSVPSENVIHRLEGDQVVKSIDNSTLPQASPEYNATVKKNIDFVETQIPGAKVFGSAKNVAETEIPHIVGDYDVLMSQTQYDKFAKANPSVGNNGFAELHNIPGAAKGVDPIDINIIQEKGGKAIGTRAEELFKQVAPDEYYAAAKKAIKNKSEIKIPYSSQELVDMTNPTTKSVIDAYESSKGKHINKIDALINYGKPTVVAEGQQQFVNSLVGSKGSIGHQFPLEQLSNAETNAEILDKIGFIGNKKLVAADPQRMQIAINDYYMNNSILARQVDKDKISKIEAAIKEYNPNAKGGAVNGIGQNHVTLGFPHHGESNILSWKQLGMDLDTTDPMAYINSIEHQTSGEKLFSQEERAILSDIVKDMKFYDHEKQLAEGSENASQLLENLPYSEEGKKALYEFGKRTNRTMAKKSTNYGNSNITMTFRDFDDAIDIMQYQLINSEYSKNPVKSFMKRTQSAENASRNQATISTDLELLPKQFKAIKGYVEGGIDKANQRLTTLNAERTKIGDDITDLSDKLYNKKYKDELDRLNAFRTKIDKEIGDMNQMRRDLHDRKVLLRNLEEKMKTVGILGGGSATLIGLGTYGYKEQNEIQKKYEKEMLKDMLKNMSKEERKEYQRQTDSIQQREDRPFIDKAAEWFVTPIGGNQNGGKVTKAKNGNQLVKLDQLTNFTNYNKPQPGGWLNKYN